jgi:hypothetical protein
MNKRNFVLGGSTTLAGSVVFASHAVAAQPLAGSQNLGARRPVTGRLTRLPDLADRQDRSTWERYVGERFTQRTPYAKALVLRSVDVFRSDDHGEQFSLVFAQADAFSPAVGTHALRHESTGQQVPIYLADAGSDAAGCMLYRADFNLLA